MLKAHSRLGAAARDRVIHNAWRGAPSVTERLNRVRRRCFWRTQAGTRRVVLARHAARISFVFLRNQALNEGRFYILGQSTTVSKV